jgi:hypothetical protein
MASDRHGSRSVAVEIATCGRALVLEIVTAGDGDHVTPVVGAVGWGEDEEFPVAHCGRAGLDWVGGVGVCGVGFLKGGWLDLMGVFFERED